MVRAIGIIRGDLVMCFLRVVVVEAFGSEED
jgi:hypothetical protein